MSKFRIPLIFTIVIYGVYRLLVYALEDNITPSLIFLIPIIILGINLILRRKLRFKNWFLSNWNILLDKNSFEFETDLSSDLLFPKIQEVVANSNYKLLDDHQSNKTLLLGTSASFWTWGENVYITILERENGCAIKLTSVTIFGSFSWGKNEENFKIFSEAFELSLTI
jgi:hypothetical protein